MRKYYGMFLLLSFNVYFSQQTENLRFIKEKYNAEIQKIKDKYIDDIEQTPLKKRSKITLKKNSDIDFLELKRNNEYLEELEKIKSSYPLSDFESKKAQADTEDDKSPQYPGGSEAFKKELADHINIEAIQGKGIIQTRIVFIVDTNGSIVTVKASGENESFNRQAELAILLIKEKWEPAKKNNQPYKAVMRVPLTLNFD